MRFFCMFCALWIALPLLSQVSDKSSSKLLGLISVNTNLNGMWPELNLITHLTPQHIE